ncbi:MAG: SUMF1/EgtB/PvdO family nonheme iron enzyme, partial [Blastocatellia bacterium]
PELGSFKEVEQVVLKALEKDRENRQQSVTAFGTELEAAYKQSQAALPEGSFAGSYDATVLTGDSSLAPATAQVVTTPTGQPRPVAESTQPDLLPPTTGAATRVIWSRRNAMAAIAVALIVVAGLVGFATIPRKEPVNAATSSATPSLRPSLMPVIQSYDFPVMTVSPTGQIEGIKQGEARFYNEDLGNGLIIEMMEIPGGSFHMGAPSETQNTPHPNERPRHKVTLPGFYMGYTEVTQAQWLLVSKLPKVSRELDPNPSAFKGDATMPVQNVSWWEAVEFCERLSIATGRTYRLPTEAEWEYACRAGTATAFCFGQTITDKIVNYDGNYPYGAGRKGITRKQPVTAGNLTAENAFGLNNTHGNMAEWCLDSWHDNYAGAPADGSSWEDGGNQSLRVFRGGSWYDGGDNCRSAFRNSYAPDIKLSIIGFRVVMIPIK